MSVEEAFIRAIVDGPGDDLPRLVYADWLDDRSDPRGPYLRAEREAVETGDIARLRELAAGFDPVWVARVSLPPIGVCIEGADISDRGPPLTEADIDAAAQRLELTFSADYRAFLLNYNGGVVRRVWGVVDGETIYAGIELRLYPLLGYPESKYPPTLDTAAAFYRAWINDPNRYEGGVLEPRVAEAFLRFTEIGWKGGDAILLGVRAPDTGGVNQFHSINYLAAYWLEDHPWPEVPSFGAFLARFLWPPPPPPLIPPVDTGLPF